VLGSPALIHRAPPPTLSRRSLLAGALSLSACGVARSASAPARRAAPAPAEEPAAPPPLHASVAALRRDAPFTCAAVHPSRPWLATGSMREDSSDWTGQAVVWDLESCEAVGLSTYEHGFGFEPGPRMLQWSPDGRRFAVAAGTNEIAVIAPGGAPLLFAPDETRDHTVEFCWWDEQTLYAAAWSDEGDDGLGGGALLSLPHATTKWLERQAAPLVLRQPTRARDARAVVGHDDHAVWAIDPVAQRLRSRTPLPGAFHDGRSIAGWSPNGAFGVFAPPAIERRYDRSLGRDAGGRTELVLFRPASPRALAQIEVPGEVVALRFAPDDRRFVVVSRTAWNGPSHCTVFDGERKLDGFDAQLAKPPHDFPDASSLVWSPGADELALLHADATVEITTLGGRRHTAWAAPKTRGEVGLVFVGHDRVALIGRQSMRVFDTRGTERLRFDVEA